MINFYDDTETCLWIITASILFLIILVITLVQFKLADRWVYYESGTK